VTYEGIFEAESPSQRSGQSLAAALLLSARGCRRSQLCHWFS